VTQLLHQYRRHHHRHHQRLYLAHYQLLLGTQRLDQYRHLHLGHHYQTLANRQNRRYHHYLQ
jgi:hypothetical protein